MAFGLAGERCVVGGDALGFEEEPANDRVAGLDGAFEPRSRGFDRFGGETIMEIDAGRQQHVLRPQVHGADLVNGADRFVGADFRFDQSPQAALRVGGDRFADNERADLDRHENSNHREQQTDRHGGSAVGPVEGQQVGGHDTQ